MNLRETLLATGCLADTLIVDAHLHCGPVPDFYANNDFRAVLDNMDRLSVTYGIVSDINVYGDTGFGGNRNVTRWLQRYPHRLRGAVFLTPADTGWENELRQCAAAGYIAVKLHPARAARSPDDPFYRKVYQTAGELHLPVLVHTWGLEDVQSLSVSASAYLQTVFIVGHSGGTVPAARQAATLAAERENVFLDLATTRAYAGLLEAQVRICTANKLLYGSDALWNSMDAMLGHVVFAEIDDDDKRKILGGNAIRLFGWGNI